MIHDSLQGLQAPTLKMLILIPISTSILCNQLKRSTLVVELDLSLDLDVIPPSAQVRGLLIDDE